MSGNHVVYVVLGDSGNQSYLFKLNNQDLFVVVQHWFIWSVQIGNYCRVINLTINIHILCLIVSDVKKAKKDSSVWFIPRIMGIIFCKICYLDFKSTHLLHLWVIPFVPLVGAPLHSSISTGSDWQKREKKPNIGTRLMLLFVGIV